MTFNILALIDVALLAILAAVAVTIVRLRNLFAAVVLAGIYSLLITGIYVLLDAVDVAFTEAAVGTGISTILFLAALSLVGHEEKRPRRRPWWPLLTVLGAGALLVYGTLDLPHYGDPNAPIHQHVASHYVEDSEDEIGIPNVVTSVLASYRGYDTLGETTVIFTAMLAVLLLLGGRHVRRKQENKL